MEIYTAAEVAAQIGCSSRTVSRHALALGIGRLIGSQRIFSAADIKKLTGVVRPGPGNPEIAKHAANRKKLSE